VPGVGPIRQDWFQTLWRDRRAKFAEQSVAQKHALVFFGNSKPIVETAVNFDGKTASTDAPFVALNGRLVVTMPTEGRRIQLLYTTRNFPDDFTLTLEFRATPNADSGVFLRGRPRQDHAAAARQLADVTELLRSFLAFLNFDHAIDVNILQLGHMAFTLA
jgi:hypothetical protein